MTKMDRMTKIFTLFSQLSEENKEIAIAEAKRLIAENEAKRKGGTK